MSRLKLERWLCGEGAAVMLDADPGRVVTSLDACGDVMVKGPPSEETTDKAITRSVCVHNLLWGNRIRG